MREHRHNAPVMLATAALFVAAHAGAPLLLAEAGGVMSREGSSSWDVISSPGQLCGDDANMRSVLVASGRLSLLAGPTPHMIAEFSHPELVNEQGPWRTATILGSWVILSCAGCSHTMSIRFNTDCTAISAAVVSTPIANATYAAIAASGPTAATAIAAVQEIDGRDTRMALASLRIDSKGRVRGALSAKALPTLVAGCVWRTLASVPSARALVSAECTCDSTEAEKRSVGGGGPAQKVVNNTFMLSTTTSEVLSATAAYLPDGSSAWVGAAWADWLGIGEPHGLLIGGSSAGSAAASSRALPILLASSSSAAVAAHGETAGSRMTAGTGTGAGQLYVGSSYVLDSGRNWSAVAHGAWLASEGAGSVQLLALRQYEPGKSGDEFVVQCLVYAPPHVMGARMRAISNTLGQQDLTKNLNVSYTRAGFNASRLKE